MASFSFYDSAGRPYNLSKAQVIALVKKNKLTKRKIYGQMAVESKEFDNLMVRLNIKLAPGWSKKENK